MSSPERQRRMADRIKELVAQVLETRIKDPRLGFITITDVRVTPDLREASVFIVVPKVAGTLRCAVSQGSTCTSINTADGTWNVPATMSLRHRQSVGNRRWQ